MVQVLRPRARVAGQSAMRSVVEAQRLARPRGLLARVAGLNPLTDAAIVSYRDALGELIVGDRLTQLGPRWDVLHDLRNAVVTIDHIVIGPTGVFTVSVVNADGFDVIVDGDTLRVGNELSEAVRVARREAEVTSRALSGSLGRQVTASALVAVTRPNRILRRARPDGVRIVSERELTRAITVADRVLSGEEVATISDVADNASTWDMEPDPLEADDVHQEFARIRDAVRRASVVRMLWGGGAVLLACGLLWASTAIMVEIVVAHV